LTFLRTRGISIRGTGKAKECGFDDVDMARIDMSQPAEWEGLVSDEDWEYLSDRLSADRRRDLRGVLSECPVALRAAFVAEIRKASGFGDRSIALAIARLMDRGDLPSPSEVSR
jgi:hypothetical protein